METVTWKAVALLSLVGALIALIIGIVAIDKAVTLEDSTRVSASPYRHEYPRSCSHLPSGSPTSLYIIRPKPEMLAFPVYCDMRTAGGGWTLVASVHENNIDGKCTAGDKWSSEQGTSGNGVLGSRNWENKNFFGNVEGVTSDDYKNPAYFVLNASNLMLWHVPNGKDIPEISSSAFLKYYTNNNFLNNYGGNLQKLFQEELPLVRETGGLNPLFDSIAENLTPATIGSIVQNWYEYKFDNPTTNNAIVDGGGDMYDEGNKVFFRINRNFFTRMTYNTPYFLYANGVEVKSVQTHPFLTLAWIGSGLNNVQADVDSFEYQVISDFGADGRGTVVTYNDRTVTSDDMIGQYSAFNIHSSGDPSICEVYFYFGSKSIWNSTYPTSIRRFNWQETTLSATNVVRFTGSPRNVIVGYTLLSKQRGELVTPEEIETVLKIYMVSAVNFSFKVTIPHIVTPVNFAVGNHDKVLSGIPTIHRGLVDPGFIQFRAFNSVGLPNALCPGVSVRSNNPEQICIGGSSTANLDIDECGDFAGWAGAPGDRGNQTTPSRTGRSINDIESSILIFIR